MIVHPVTARSPEQEQEQAAEDGNPDIATAMGFGNQRHDNPSWGKARDEV